MDFIKDLMESKSFPSPKSFSRHSGRDYANMAFLTLIGLNILRTDPKLAPEVRRFAMLAHRDGNWSDLVFASNDLAILLHLTLGQGKEADANRKLAKAGPDMGSIDVNRYQVARYLMAIAHNTDTNAKRMFLHFQNGFAIEVENYKSVRRLAQEWEDLTHHEQTLVVTRMLQFFRMRMPQSPITAWMNRFAKTHRLENKKAHNPELKEGVDSGVVAYHGTDQTFVSFNAKFLGSANGTGPANMAGFNFTNSPEVARSFGGNVIKVRLHLSNPLVIDAKGRGYGEFKHILNARLAKVSRSKHDGIIIKSYGDAGKYSDEVMVSDHYIVFDPASISVGGPITENATAGASSSGGIATSIGGLGAGFDNDYSKSIYPMVRRQPTTEDASQSQADLIGIASAYHEQSTEKFTPRDYKWRMIDFDITLVMSVPSWISFIENEIEAFATEMDQPNRFDDILNEPITDPIVVVRTSSGEYDIWDGNHRCGAAAKKGQRLLRAVYGEL